MLFVSSVSVVIVSTIKLFTNIYFVINDISYTIIKDVFVFFNCEFGKNVLLIHIIFLCTSINY